MVTVQLYMEIWVNWDVNLKSRCLNVHFSESGISEFMDENWQNWHLHHHRCAGEILDWWSCIFTTNFTPTALQGEKPRRVTASVSTWRKTFNHDTTEALATLASSKTDLVVSLFLRTTCSSGQAFCQHQGALLPTGLKLQHMMYPPGERVCKRACVWVWVSASPSEAQVSEVTWAAVYRQTGAEAPSGPFVHRLHVCEHGGGVWAHWVCVQVWVFV